jgi:anaerobic selenocysteine-containing dehydrogenase
VCSIIATVEDGVVTKLDGDPHHPVTQGYLCGKGRRLKDRLYSKHRLLYPQKKVNGNWVRISWDEAYEEIAEAMRKAMDTYGHHSILHAYDWGSGTVLKNLNQRFFYLLGGCTETVGSLCWDAGIEAQRYDFGQARSHAPTDTAKAKAVVVWGRNVSVTNIHMMPFIRQAQSNGAKLVVVNPLQTDADGRADLRISPRPGSDAALALGVLKYCKDQGWLDETFIERHSIGFDQLSAYIERFDLHTTSELTDVPPEDIVKLAQLYGQIKPVTTLLGIGLQRYAGGGNAIRAIDALVAATGHIGIEGGGVNYAHRQIPEFLDQGALTQRHRANVREFTRGTQAEDILAADPPIQVMFVTRTNPVTQVPDTGRLLEAYRTIPFKVVIDMFMTPTAEQADYVLPCTSVLEDEDFVFSTMWHGNITYISPVVEKLGEVKADWEIFADLADRFGFGHEMRKPLDEWFDMVLAPLKTYGLGTKELKEKGTITLPLADVPWQDYKFRTPSGKFEFYSETALREGHSPHAEYIPGYEVGELGGDKAYPYALLTIHPRVSENSQHKDFPNLREYPIVEIHEAVAEEKGLKENDLALLWNDQASLKVVVHVVKSGHPRTIKMESGWWGQGLTVNHLTKIRQADFGQQTAQYDCTCNIAPVKS